MYDGQDYDFNITHSSPTGKRIWHLLEGFRTPCPSSFITLLAMCMFLCSNYKIYMCIQRCHSTSLSQRAEYLKMCELLTHLRSTFFPLVPLRQTIVLWLQILPPPPGPSTYLTGFPCREATPLTQGIQAKSYDCVAWPLPTQDRRGLWCCLVASLASQELG